MLDLLPFALEDFFAEFEHRRDLLNLGSSDAAPWTLPEILRQCPGLQRDLEQLSFGYPDVQRSLVPKLRDICKPPAQMDILAVSGAAEAIFLVLTEFRSRGIDSLRIAVPRPSYGAFAGIARLSGYEMKDYAYTVGEEWSLDAEGLRKVALNADIVVVNNPHNPTGWLMDEDLLKEISDIVAENDGMLLVDEVFRLPGDCTSATRFGPQVTVISSLSKVYGMPGLRLGWMVTSETHLNRLRTVQQYTTLTPNIFTQAVGQRVLEHLDLFSRRTLLQTNRSILLDWAHRNSRLVRLVTPQAGTTAVLEIISSRSEEDLFRLFESSGVLLVPGARCFGVTGAKPWFRLGYGAPENVLREGLDVISQALRRNP
ncbi:MAG TPA: pyridoxal phosphate-dependent aminotransferase [Pyrinomonadaceae bacterium]|nr:pyridoxal phosphate-dependent aminotransferase [Pyrinomonadaceae bacterium]